MYPGRRKNINCCGGEGRVSTATGEKRTRASALCSGLTLCFWCTQAHITLITVPWESDVSLYSHFPGCLSNLLKLTQEVKKEANWHSSPQGQLAKEKKREKEICGSWINAFPPQRHLQTSVFAHPIRKNFWVCLPCVFIYKHICYKTTWSSNFTSFSIGTKRVPE